MVEHRGSLTAFHLNECKGRQSLTTGRSPLHTCHCMGRTPHRDTDSMMGGQLLGQSRCGNFAYQAGLLEISIDNTFRGDEYGSPILPQFLNWEIIRREGATCLSIS